MSPTKFESLFQFLKGMIVQIIMGVLMIISMGVTSACGDLESRDIQIRSKAKKSITGAGCCAFLVGICVLFTHRQGSTYRPVHCTECSPPV